MWNQVVLAALIPAMMAKPIMPRSDITGVEEPQQGPGFDAAAFRENTLTALGEALQEKAADGGGDTSQLSHMSHEERRQISKSQVSELTNEAASTIFAGASEGVMGWATSIRSQMSTSLPHMHIPRANKLKKATSTPTPTASSSSTASASGSARPTESTDCDCLNVCAKEDGKASQMKCMDKCSRECDGDDDKQEDKDLLGSLTKNLFKSLGDRSVPMPPPPSPYRKFHHPPPKVVHEAGAAEFESFEACLNSCKSHNCQKSGVGLDISQCGDTSCEDRCAGYKAGASKFSKTIVKKHDRPVADQVKADTPLPHHKKPVVAAHHSESFEDCLKKCHTHNCQNSGVGLGVSQCGDTSCEDACAGYKGEGGIIITKRAEQSGNTDQVPEVPEVATVPTVPNTPEVPPTPEVPTVPTVPEVPQVKGGPVKAAAHEEPKPHSPAPNHKNFPVAAGAAEDGEYDACLKKCHSHNCQKSGVGLDVEQCGRTSCFDACASLKHSASAGVSAHKVKVPYAPGTLAAHPGPDPPVEKIVPEAGAHESREYDDCVRECKTHNCQKADVGLEVSQCGDTSCTDSCAHLKEGHAAHLQGAPRDMHTATAPAYTPVPAAAAA
ncbi:hypothetical protein F5Y11DRAFT_217079 [Daldinia sp. FL1419]|nr:hypothetical protein F5Y11DRAFT_217079 [Daldinia sp. FL1419]